MLRPSKWAQGVERYRFTRAGKPGESWCLRMGELHLTAKRRRDRTPTRVGPLQESSDS